MTGVIIACTIIGTLLAVGEPALAHYIAEKGGKNRAQLLSLGKEIAAKISGNNVLLNKIINAYNAKNTALLNATYRGMGFGPRMTALSKMIKDNEGELQDATNKIGQLNTNLGKLADEANNAASNAGTSLKGNKIAEEDYQTIKAKLDQNINGGITENA